ncbi:uncharacterized protein LOC131166816 [Malania oleifera]|uniref:uncharacterized protein LOC131166816 n=1 Tax=Malania oleifera TaxID=397392 RepID=UPI0025AE185D|nr:uncharacterized protein LOC131166816 [Malania oleifera]
MAGSSASNNRPHVAVSKVSSRVQTKSYAHFVFKFVLVACVLVSLPLFPSQAPESINKTMLAKFWELLHLTFIGIAVCYGLFSRRNADTDIEIPSSADNSESYMSKMLHVSAIFEDGFENPSGSAERKRTQTWNSQCFRSEPMVAVTDGRCVVSGQCDADSRIENKPVGFPGGRLRWGNLDHGTLEYINGGISESGPKGSSNSFGGIKKGNFVELGTSSMDENVEEPRVLPSPIPWRLRSRRMEAEEAVSFVAPSESVPLSVEECHSELPESWSFESTRSFSSKTSSREEMGIVTSSDSMPLSVEETQFEPYESHSFQPARSPWFRAGYTGEVGTFTGLDSMPPSGEEFQFDLPKSQSFWSNRTPWSRTSSRDEGGIVTPSGSMHLPVGETQFEQHESHESQSFWSTTSPWTRTGSTEEAGTFTGLDSMPPSLEEFQYEPPKSRSFRSRRTSRSRTSMRDEVDIVTPSDSMPFTAEEIQFDSQQPTRNSWSRGSSREEMGTATASDSMPPSEEEFQFEPFESQSFQSSSFSSGTSSISSSPTMLSPSSSVTSEVPNSKIEELEEKKSSASSSTTSEFPNSKIEERDGKKSSPSSSITSELPNSSKELDAEKSSYISVFPSMSPYQVPLSHSHQHSYGSFSELNVPNSFKDKSKYLRRSGKEDLSGNKEWNLDALKSDTKPKTIAKASFRGKSVRTIRASENAVEARKAGEICQPQGNYMVGNQVEAELMGKAGRKTGHGISVSNGKQDLDNPAVWARKPGEIFRDQRDDMVGKRYNKVEAELMGKAGRKPGGHDNLSFGSRKQNLDNPIPKQKSAFHKSKNGGKQEFNENIIVESDGGLECEGDKLPLTSNGEEYGAEADTSEVDKKAGEFIAKFRQQISHEKISGNEVDKKAGEFIAKFREQIRLETGPARAS